MIEKIGVIYQDPTSRGFLVGLRDRLGCRAGLVGPPPSVGKIRVLTRRQARLAWRAFQSAGVDLIVRFTDADGDRWQSVQREELTRIPEEAKELWICAVAVNNPEEWLCGDTGYISGILGLQESELSDADQRTDRVKAALRATRPANESLSEFVARIVRDAPPNVFRAWLREDALRSFYVACRNAAAKHDCDTPNELADDGK